MNEETIAQFAARIPFHQNLAYTIYQLGQETNTTIPKVAATATTVATSSSSTTSSKAKMLPEMAPAAVAPSKAPAAPPMAPGIPVPPPMAPGIPVPPPMASGIPVPPSKTSATPLPVGGPLDGIGAFKLKKTNGPPTPKRPGAEAKKVLQAADLEKGKIYTIDSYRDGKKKNTYVAEFVKATPIKVFWKKIPNQNFWKDKNNDVSFQKGLITSQKETERRYEIFPFKKS